MTQILAFGLIDGLLTSVLAMAFLTVYMPVRVFHLALGAIIVIVPLLTQSLLQIGFSTGIALALGCLAGILISVICEVANHGPLYRKGVSAGGQLISSMGILFLLNNLAIVIWGSESRVMRTGLEPTINLGSVSLSQTHFLVATMSALVVVTYYLLLSFTKIGVVMKGMHEDPVECALYGFNLRLWRAFFFGTAGLLAGAYSLMRAYDVGLNPNVSISTIIPAVGVILLTRRPSFIIPLIAAIIFGLLKALSTIWAPASWQDPIAFSFLVIALFSTKLSRGSFLQKLR